MARWGLCALLIAAGRTWAGDTTEVCVANDSQFAAAAEQAGYTLLTIKVVQGTYHLAGTAFAANSGNNFGYPGFSLLGGYTANCASRQIDPANTHLISAASASSFYTIMYGDITIEGIGFGGPGAGVYLAWEDYVSEPKPSVQATFRRNSITDGGQFGYGALQINWVADDSYAFNARIVDNLVHDNPGEGDGGYCAVELNAMANASFDLINNTIVDNATGDGGICFGRYGDDSGSLFAYNNIVYGNVGYDFASNSPSFALVDNVIGTHNAYPPPIFQPVGTLTGSPELDASFHPIEAPPSPVINSGTNSVPGGLPAHDLDGGPRVVGTTVDRGAYESTINDAFLQTVTNTNDSGNGSLRAAIASANANGSVGALISFDLGSGCGPHVVTLTSSLPDITAPVIINGFTQTGASPNDLDVGNDATICVILDAGSSGSPPDHAIATANTAPDATQVTIKGLAFSGFSGAAIDLAGGSGHEIAGDHFGGSVSGHGLGPNGIDIRLGIATHGSIVGGDDPANRNIVGGALGDGIVLQGGGSGATALGTYDNQVLNNYVGIGWSSGSYTQRSNGGDGILLQGHDNTLSGNLIGTNIGSGIRLDGGAAAANLMQGNFIGADAAGTAFGNFARGVHFAGDIGSAPHDNTVRGNTIANNDRAGIWVQIGQHNKLRKNAISDNGALGIDLAGGGVTPNDDDSGVQEQDYANRGQNFPVLAAAIGGAHQGTVSGTLTTTPGDYTVDIYANGSCDDTGNGEGEIWLRGARVTVPSGAGGQGTANFAIAVARAAPHFLTGGQAITATATDAAGDTSEFSACIGYIDDTIFADGFDPPPV